MILENTVYKKDYPFEYCKNKYLMKKITIIDYGLGNIKSVQRAFEISGSEILVTSNYKDLIQSEKLLLPGVGTFSDGMKGLNELDLVKPITDFVSSGKPILGICLGMQLMFEKGEEFGNHSGLGFVEGQVTAIPIKASNETEIRKVPHVGWNRLNISSHEDKFTVLNGIESKDYFYFIHSYMGVLSDKDNLLASCNYEGIEFVAGINKDNITGLQFHPEKSGEKGLKIIKNFINL